MNTTTAHDSQRRTIQVYFLAAPEDQDVCEAIQEHLSPVVRSSPIPIEVNSDFNIPVGAERETHKQRLFEADVVLALISSDFIDDDEIYKRHQKVIERFNNRETEMISILVRNCLWKVLPFANLGMLPKNLQPLNNRQFWNSQDDAVTEVVSDIYEAINELTQREAVQPSSAAEVESAPDLEAASETSRSQARSQPRAVSPVTVDWRTGYYRTVLMKRAGAIFLDTILSVFVPLFALLVIFFAITGAEDISNEALAFFAIIVYFVVLPIMESSKWQGTIGKRILKLQITNRDGERISFFRAVWRNIMRTIVLYSYFFVIPLIVQYFRFRKTRKLFHDELSGTVIGERLASSGVVSLSRSVA